MKYYLKEIIIFTIGFFLATIIWLNIGTDKKYTETDLKRAELRGRDKMDIELSEQHRKEIQALEKELVKANKEVERLKNIPIKVYKPDFKTDKENQKWFDEESNKYTKLRR